MLALLLACADPRGPSAAGPVASASPVVDGDRTAPDPDDPSTAPGDTGVGPWETSDPADDDEGPPVSRRPQEWLGLCDAWDVPTMETLHALSEADGDADDAVALGLGYVRPHRPTGSVFARDLVRPAGADADDWSYPDHVVLAAAERGLGVIGTLAAVGSADDDSAVVVPLVVDEADMDAWLAFVQRVVERYDGDGTDDMPGLSRPVLAWQIGNESTCRPDTIAECGPSFTDLMMRTYTAAKAASADTTVLVAGAGPVFAPDATVQQEFLAPYVWFFEHGGADYTDAFDFHVQVGSPVPPVAEYLTLWRGVVGDDLPLWIGETGTRSAAGSTEWPDAATEAGWMTGFLDTALNEEVERVLWCRGGLETHEVPAEVLDAVAAFAESLPPG